MKKLKQYSYLFGLTLLLTNCSSEEVVNDPNNIDPGPFSVTILETRIDGANIEWTESIDIDDDPVTYSIYLDDQLISTGGTALSYNFTNLEPETVYDGYILADDGKGGASQSDFFFETEPETIILTLEPTYWIRDSFPEGDGTRFIYDNGFIVPRDDNATSYQIEIINYIFDDFPYFVGSVFNWTNDSPDNDVISFDEEANEFRVLLTGVSVNSENSAFDELFANVTGVTGEAEVIITLESN